MTAAAVKEGCEMARDAISRINTHEAVCEERSRRINETMDRIETTTRSAHENIYESIERISNRMLSVLTWSVILFGGSTFSLIVYIYLHTPRG